MRHDNSENQRPPKKNSETDLSHVRGRVSGRAGEGRVGKRSGHMTPESSEGHIVLESLLGHGTSKVFMREMIFAAA